MANSRAEILRLNNKALFLFVVLLTAMPVSRLLAQPSFSFGPKVGYTSSHLTTNQDSLLTDFQQGFQAGLFFRFTSGFFYIQPEVVYNTKGGIFENSTKSFREEVFLNSVDVPLLFGFKLGEDELNFRIHGGPVASFIIEKSIKMSSDSIIGVMDGKNLKDSFLGAQVGVGIDIMPFSLDVRYEVGWDNIYLQLTGNPDYNWQPRAFNISLAYKLF